MSTPIFDAVANEMGLTIRHDLGGPVRNLFARQGWFNGDTSWYRDLD